MLYEVACVGLNQKEYSQFKNNQNQLLAQPRHAQFSNAYPFLPSKAALYTFNITVFAESPIACVFN
jgi:hypothetical protein